MNKTLRLSSRWTYVVQAFPIVIVCFVPKLLQLPHSARDLPKPVAMMFLAMMIIATIWGSLQFCHIKAEGDTVIISSWRFSGRVPLERIVSVWPGSGSRTHSLVILMDPPLNRFAREFLIIPPEPFGDAYGKKYNEVWDYLSRNGAIGLNSENKESALLAMEGMRKQRVLFFICFLVCIALAIVGFALSR